MTEAAPHPHHSEAVHDPTQTSAEIITLSDVATEKTVANYIDTLFDRVEAGKHSGDLAVEITEVLDDSADPSAPDYAQALRQIRNRGNAFGEDGVFEHKTEHDEVFARLVSLLQTTHSQQRSLHDQRRAALRLAELRAAVPADETVVDTKWQAVIERLFG